MAVEYDISSDVAVIKETGSVSQCARVTQMYSGQITYDDEAGSKFATATINGKSQRVMLCIAVNGTVAYDDVPSLYSTVDGHRCLNIVTPTETGTPDDVPSLYETVVIDGQNVRAVRCIMINKTPVYDGVSSTCTFTGDDGKTHTAQLVNKITGGSVEVIIKGTSPLVLPDAIANSLSYVKAFGGTEQRNIPQPYTQVNYVTNTAQTAVDTGVMIDFAKNYEFEVECRAVSGSWYILQSRASSSGNITGIHGATSGNTITLVVGNVTICTSAITRTVGNKLYVKATLNAGTATLYVKDETANTEDTQTGSYGTSQPNPTAAVYLLGNAGGQYVDVNSDIYMARIKENGVTVMDYVPARQVATAGFYDKASGTFKTALTPANLSADGNTVPTPDTPMDIISNNGVLKVSPNLFNKATVSKYTLINTASGNTMPQPDEWSWCSDFIPVTPGTAYYFKAGTNYAVRMFEYDGNKSYLSRNYTVQDSSFTVGATCKFIRFHVGYTAGGQGMYEGETMLSLGSTALPYHPYVEGGIYTDGTVETINVHGKNLFDGAIELGSINPADGSLVVSTTRTRSANFISVQPNTTYTFTRENSDGIRWIVGYNENKVGITDGNFSSQASAITNMYASSDLTKSFTTTPTTHYIKWYNTSDAGLNEKVQIELGSPATTYEPYFDGGTATAEMLLKVGDYQDVQSIIDGVVTRKVGVKVFDGTEDWEVVAGTSGFYSLKKEYFTPAPVLSSSIELMCSHALHGASGGRPTIQTCGFGNSYFNFNWDGNNNALSGFKAYLSQQYAAGTPVIVIYPLATPTTESVTGQHLQVTDGDNVLEITQASLDGLELEAEYQAAVSLTIQEVEDANLDNNVTVTIQ